MDKETEVINGGVSGKNTAYEYTLWKDFFAPLEGVFGGSVDLLATQVSTCSMKAKTKCYNFNFCEASVPL